MTNPARDFVKAGGLMSYVANMTSPEANRSFRTFPIVPVNVVGSSIFLNTRRRQLAALAVRHGIPAIANIREFVLAGGLMSYGAIDSDAYRCAGAQYVARILKGAKPGDLPVEMPTKYELVISVVAAKALGLDVPAKLLTLADEVIE